MTLRANSRLAGFTLLFYIAVGITEMVLMGRATSGPGAASKLASIAQNATLVRFSALLTLTTALCALVLAATIYALTRDYDRDLARLAMLCRVVEGASNAAGALALLRLVAVANAAAGAAGADLAAANALGSMLLTGGGMATALIFAVGSTIYCYIFLRARTIPLWMAWLGVVASVLLVVWLPLEILRIVQGGWLPWIPMLVFEVTFAVWLQIKGVAARANRPDSSMSTERPALV